MPKKKILDEPAQSREELVDKRAAARYLGISPETLGYWRALGRGPRVLKLGTKTFRYAIADLRAFLEQAATIPTADNIGNREPQGRL